MNTILINEFTSFLENKKFPCVAARAALTKGHIRFFTAGHMACPRDDRGILDFLYGFVDEYRSQTTQFHSAVIIFENPEEISEEMFDKLLWTRLQSLADIDKEKYLPDPRVDADPASPAFSFSLKQEAFFVVGLNPGSSRLSRKFKYPALVFNPHSQFVKLRSENTYDKMKAIVRKREMEYSGSINPMLDDFGKSSEVFQYSGMKHDANWQCPLHIKKLKQL
jgi:FPC/CPF motif-containing protein YcgG